jgi:hypothetical protein
MSGESTVDRRVFLVRTFMVAAAGVLGSPLAGCGSGGGEADPQDLAAWMGRDDAVIRLGQEYLAAHQDEADTGVLTGLLAAGLPDLEDPAARTDLLARVREDYAAGRTAILSGWVLSISEGRLCALATLVTQGQSPQA